MSWSVARARELTEPKDWLTKLQWPCCITLLEESSLLTSFNSGNAGNMPAMSLGGHVYVVFPRAQFAETMHA